MNGRSAIHAKSKGALECFATILNGTSSRGAWWLSLAVCFAGIGWSIQIYENSLSFFLRRADTFATFQAVCIAALVAAIFVIVTIRRANSLRVGRRIRWTLLIPPFWLFWIPVLGAMKSSSPEDPDAFKRLVRRLLISGGLIGTVAAIVVVSIMLWQSLGGAYQPSVRADETAVRAEIDPIWTIEITDRFDTCVTKGNQETAKLETWPVTAAGQDVFEYVLKRCFTDETAF